MAVCLISYTGEALETKNKCENDKKRDVCINTLYFNSNYGFYFYYNNKGYFHTVKLEKMNMLGKKCIAICDYLLTKKNTIKLVSQNIIHGTNVREAIDYINENYNVAENPDFY